MENGIQMNATTTRVNDWLRCYRRQPDVQFRLFCFPYAGGGATVYRLWGQQLPAAVEVQAVQLPGREDRFKETALTSMEQLLDALVPALLPFLDRPYAFFGHSMGSAIAYALSCRLSERGLPLPLAQDGQRPACPARSAVPGPAAEPLRRNSLRGLAGQRAACARAADDAGRHDVAGDLSSAVNASAPLPDRLFLGAPRPTSELGGDGRLAAADVGLFPHAALRRRPFLSETAAPAAAERHPAAAGHLGGAFRSLSLRPGRSGCSLKTATRSI